MSLIKKTARILSIDGGGIRGLIPATIIASWETVLGPIANNFHMITGTSTGGILATALAKGVSANDLINFYKAKGPEIFSSSIGSLGGLAGQMYDSQPLEAAIKSVLKGTLSTIQKDLLVTSYDLQARMPFLFKSWKARGIELNVDERASDNNFQLSDMARATSAAPTFFPPAKVKSATGKTYGLIDGGVYANNPAMCAYVAARRLYPKADEYIIVSLGTGALTKPVPFADALDYGLAGWLRPLLDIMFDGVSSTTEYELSQLPQVSQYRFQTSLAGASEAMDDASETNLNNLIKVSKITMDTSKKDMDGLVTRLHNEKLTTLSALGYPAATDPPKPANPVTVVPKKKLITPVNSVTALGGATAGAIVGGPIGAAIGAIGGWLIGHNEDK